MANSRINNADLLQPILDIKTDIGKLFGGQREVKADIIELKEATQTISLEMPELLRKVDEHHTMYRDLKEADCPNIKVMPKERPKDGNGDPEERRTKKSWRRQFREMPFTGKLKVLMWAIPLLIIYWEWIFDKAHSLLTWLEAVPK